MRRRSKVALAAVVVGVAIAAVAFVRTVRYGFSAHDKPTRIEHVLARTMRRLATPSDLRDRKNPVPPTAEVLAEGRAHFADHCAICHGNDGKGQTEMGPHFYPHAPDMTQPETQSQSDGALFATIENGVRLTGMPAWGNGTAESAYGSWTLVHFIRHMPRITAEELKEMEDLNPRSREEWQASEEERSFLKGQETPARPTPGQPSTHGHH